jgi:hypothetical protein
MKMTDPKLYILKLKFGIQRKRLFFEGPSEDDGGKAAFEDARAGLNEIGDKSLDFEAFVGSVIEHFAKAGFMRVAH